MDPFTLIQTATLILAFYMAWNIGANDVANAMGTSVGSKALTLKKAVVLAAILEFSGAFFSGKGVSETIQKGIIDPTIFQHEPMTFVLGMMGALLATGALLQLASYFALPISTTHAIVGAVVGFGAAVGGIDAVYWGELGWITSSWILSPVLSGILSYAIFTIIQRKILFALDPVRACQKVTPYFVFFCFAILTLSMLFHGLNLDLSTFDALLISGCIGLIAALASTLIVRRIAEPALQLVPDHKNFQRNLRLDFLCEQGAEDDGNLHQVVESEREAGREKMGQIPNKFCGKVLADGFHPHQAVSLEKALHHLQRVHISNQSKSYSEQISNILTQMQALNEKVKKSAPYTQSAHHYHGVEKIFISMQILSACLVAFAHGANDVANAIGPAAAVFGVLKTQTINASSTVPSWLLALGGIGIIIGLATWGWRVIETVGKKITELTPTRGFAAEFGAATTILLASKLGLPISTTHALIGAVLGVGMARGLKALNLQTLKEIVVSWVVTIPLCALFSMIAFYLLKLLFF